jgi:hypothetical protein
LPNCSGTSPSNVPFSPGWACLQGRFEDNGFLLLPLTPRKIKFHATSADGPIDIAHFQRELVVRSPRDVY